MRKDIVAILAVFLFLAVTGPACGVDPYIPPGSPGGCGYEEFPNVCDNGTGCDGSGVSIIVASLLPCTDTGSWSFAGTGYAACGHSLATPCFPLLRYWEHDHFVPANSGCQKQDYPGIEWLKNGTDLSCGPGFEPIWYAINTCWCGAHFGGNPSSSLPLTVFEFSDREEGWFSISCFWDAGGGMIDPSATDDGKPVPMTPIPTPLSAGEIAISGAWRSVAVHLPAAPPEFGQAGRPQLIAGAAVVYFNGLSAPANPHDPTAWPGWAGSPGEHNDKVPLVIPWDAITVLEVPVPAAGESTFVGVVVAYVDASVVSPDFLGSLAVSEALRVVRATELVDLYRGQPITDPLPLLHGRVQFPFVDPDDVFNPEAPPLLFYQAGSPITIHLTRIPGAYGDTVRIE